MVGILLATVSLWITQTAPVEEHERTLDELRVAAEGGDGDSQFFYAVRLEHGTGVTADPAAAARWYEKAAAQGLAGAMVNLGLMFLDGRGVPADDAKGVEWMGRAGDAGSGVALANLGLFHFLGRHGLPKDAARGAELSCAAARLGESSAIANLRRYLPGEHLDLVDDSFDLKEVLRIGEPLLIEVESDASLKTEVRSPGGSRVDSGRDQAKLRLVDEIQELGSEWKATRRIVLSQHSVDGEVRDDELNGAVVSIVTTGQKRRAELADGRSATKKRMNWVLNGIDSAGADVVFPAVARIGEEFDLSLEMVAPLLFDLDGEIEESSGKAHLEAFDAAKKIARIVGRCALTEKESDKDGEIATHFTFDVVIEMDLAARVLRTLRATGESAATGRRFATTFTGHADFTASMKTSDAEAARKAVAAAPTYRDVRRKVDAAGVSLALPSHFFETTVPAESESTFASLLSEGRDVTIALQSCPIDDLAMNEAMRQVEEALVESVPGVVTRKETHSGLGKGRGITFVNEGNHFDVEIYPLGKDRIIRIRVYGAEEVKKAMQPELARFRGSLQALKR